MCYPRVISRYSCVLCAHQVFECYLSVISRCLFVFDVTNMYLCYPCDQQVSICVFLCNLQVSVFYPCVISRCLFVFLYVISRYLCAILV